MLRFSSRLMFCCLIYSKIPIDRIQQTTSGHNFFYQQKTSTLIACYNPSPIKIPNFQIQKTASKLTGVPVHLNPSLG